MSSTNVKFWRGNQEQYSVVGEVKNNIIYFVNVGGTGESLPKPGIYVGGKLIAAGEENFKDALVSLQARFAGFESEQQTIAQYVDSRLGAPGTQGTVFDALDKLAKRVDVVEGLLGKSEDGTVTGSAIKTTSDFKVTGVEVGNLTDGLTIGAGTDVMSILKQMLTKRLTAHKITAQPNAIIGGISKETVEVGTTVATNLTVSYADGMYEGRTKDYNEYSKALGCASTGVTVKAGNDDLGELRAHTVTLSTNGSQTPVYKVIYTHTEGANAGSSAEFKVYDNLGVEISEVEYAAIRKIAGSVEASTPVKTAAYYTFYGSIADNRSEWTSEQIRALASKGFSAKPD
ncbi:MAG: hypothetical protein RSE41_05485, partial [Clostridia bacterium]